MLCPPVGSPLPESLVTGKHGLTGASPEKGHKGAEEPDIHRRLEKATSRGNL